jgi:hypothetical protein
LGTRTTSWRESVVIRSVAVIPGSIRPPAFCALTTTV